VTTRFSAEPSASYGEFFAGLLGSGWSVRLYASPDYYGCGTPSSYVEYDAARTLAPGWRGLLHASALTWLGNAPAGLPPTCAGLRLRLSWTPGDAQLQLAWDTRSGRSLYPYGTMHEAAHSAWVLSLGYAF
jgi:hypothetical protein